MKMKFDSKTVMPIVMAGSGGFVGSQLTTIVEKQSFMAGKEQFAPLVTAGLSIFGAIGMPKMNALFTGMATVAVTELLENLVSTVTAPKAPAAAAAVAPAAGALKGSLDWGMGYANNQFTDGNIR